jgi:hypothetical protein
MLALVVGPVSGRVEADGLQPRNSLLWLFSQGLIVAVLDEEDETEQIDALVPH